MTMQTVQMTLESALVKSLDGVVKRLGTTRSAFTRQALRSALEHLRDLEREERQRAGYKKKPVKKGEFGSVAHAWGDE